MIGRTFEHCLDLKKLNLSHNLITAKDQQFEVFLIKAGQLLQELQLDLSNNMIDDRCITAIEARMLYDDSNQIAVFNLSYNQLTKQGIWRLYLGYVESKKLQNQFQMILFPLPFSVELFQNVPANFANFVSPNESIFFNEAEPLSKKLIHHNQQLVVNKESDLPIYMTRKSLSYQKTVKKDQADFKNEKSMTIQRSNSSKLPVLQKRVLG